MSSVEPKMNVDDLNSFLAEQFPDRSVDSTPTPPLVESVTEQGVQLRWAFRRSFLRPGGTISGPTMMTLADTAAYLAILAFKGPMAMAVTSSLTMHFLSKPAPKDLIGIGHLRSLGRRSAVVAVSVFSAGEDAPVAEALVSYALPSPS